MKSRYDVIILGAGHPPSVAAATFGVASKGIVNR
jgi:alkyl hydroperoxide reductase subunit AhpF